MSHITYISQFAIRRAGQVKKQGRTYRVEKKRGGNREEVAVACCFACFGLLCVGLGCIVFLVMGGQVESSSHIFWPGCTIAYHRSTDSFPRG